MAKKELKQVEAPISGEFGELPTVIAAISADGNAIPPLIKILYRQRDKGMFLQEHQMGLLGQAVNRVG